jgi:hypothetical protein
VVICLQPKFVPILLLEEGNHVRVVAVIVFLPKLLERISFPSSSVFF